MGGQGGAALGEGFDFGTFEGLERGGCRQRDLISGILVGGAAQVKSSAFAVSESQPQEVCFFSFSTLPARMGRTLANWRRALNQKGAPRLRKSADMSVPKMWRRLGFQLVK